MNSKVVLGLGLVLAVAVATASAQNRVPGCNTECGCIQNWDPVCGTDGVTHSNAGCLQCAASCQPGLRVAYRGECGSAPSRPGPNNFDPFYKSRVPIVYNFN